MGFSLVTAGLFFLFNPTINVVDPLPDFIGYLLIVIGLTKTASVAGKIDTARDQFWKLFLITLVKMLSALFIPFTDDTFTLVLVFSFAVVELMFIYSAFSALFEGIGYTGIRYDGTAALKSKTKKRRISLKTAKKLIGRQYGQVTEETEVSTGKKKYYFLRTVERTQSVKAYTLFFMTLKLGLTIIPELPSLQLFEYIGSISADVVDYTQFVPLFLTFVWVITLIFGIPWLVRTAAFITSLKKDTPYIEAMRDTYDGEILPNVPRRTAGIMTPVLTLIGLGVVFTFNLYIDHVNATPNFIAAAFMLAAGIMMMRYTKAAATILVSSVFWGMASVYNMIKQTEYFGKYTLNSVRYVPEAAAEHEMLCITNSVEFAIGIAVYIFLFVSLIRTMKEHISMIPVVSGHIQYDGEDRFKEIRYTVNSRSIAMAVLGGISMVGSALHHFFAREVGVFLPIVMVFQIIFIAYSIYSLLIISDEVYKRLRGEY